MSTWLEQFAARTEAISKSRGAVTRGGSDRDAILRLLQSKGSTPGISRKMAEESKPSDKTLASFAGEVKDDFISGGSRVLDVLSRGNYASASFIRSLNEDENEAEKAGNDVGVFGKGVDYDWMDAFKEAGRGLAGRNKSTYSDVFRDNGMSGRGIGTAGFIADVALDPTTYIGAGLIKAGLKGTAKGVQKATKAAGKEIDLTRLGRAKNTLSTDDVVDPSKKIEADLNEGGKTANPVNKSMVEKIIAQRNAKSVLKAEGDQSYDIVPDNKWGNKFDEELDSLYDDGPGFSQQEVKFPTITNTARLLEAPPKARFTADSKGVVEDTPWRNQAERLKAHAALESAQGQHRELLSGIEARRYSDDLDIKPMHREITEEVDSPFIVERSEQIPNPKASNTEVLKSGMKALQAENWDGKVGGFRLYGRSGAVVKKIFLDDNKTKFGNKELGKLDAAATKDELGKTLDRLPAKVLGGWLKAGKVPDSLEGMHFKFEGKLIPVKEYVERVAKSAEDAFLLEDEFITRTWKEVEIRKVPQTKIAKFTPAERMAWVAEYSKVLDPEDIKALVRAANLGPKAFTTTVGKIKSQIKRRDFTTVDELRAAQTAGLITDVGRQVLEGRLSRMGAKYPYQIEKRVEKFQRELSKAQNAPTKTARVKAEKAVKKAEEAAVKAIDTENVKANLSMDSADEIMSAPEVVASVEARVAAATDEAGNVTPDQSIRGSLTETQAKIVERIMKDVNDLEFVKPKGTPYRTATGAARDSATPGVGKAWYFRGFNKYSQLTLGKKIISEASKLVRGTDVAGRPAAMYDMTLPMLKAAEEVLRNNGVPIILGKSSRGLPMSMHDVLTALPREFVEQFYFTPNRSFDITQLADITEQYILKGLGHRDERIVQKTVEQLLKNDTRAKGGTSALNKSLKEMGGDSQYFAMVTQIDMAFEEAMPALMKSLAANSSRAVIDLGKETKALTDAGIQAINDVITNPNSTAGSVIRAALDSHIPVREAAKSATNKVSGEAEALAEQAVAAHVADTLPMAVVATYARAGRAFNKATTPNDFAKIQVKLADSADVEAKGILDELADEIDPSEYSTLDLGKRAEFTMGVRVWRGLAPHLGNENLRPILTERLSVNQSLAKRFTNILAKINMEHPKEELAEAFLRMQTSDVIDTPAMEALNRAMKELFDVDPEYGTLVRNGIRAEHLQSKFAHFGIGDMYKLDPKNIEQSWKNWPKIDDPLDFLSKFDAAVRATVAENQMGADISRMFGKSKPGKNGKWVQIRDPKGKSKLATLIDRDLYYPEDIARQMHMIDETLAELARPGSQSKFLKILDSALHSYKAGVTIYRPGHHVRNMVGDLWLSSLDGVTSSAYRKAHVALSTRKSQYADFDSLRALENAYQNHATVPKTLLTLNFKGEKIALSADQIYRMAFDNGTLPDYSVLEDIAFGATQQADQVADTLKKFSPFKGKVHKAAAGASEYRDHYVRIAHFIHALEGEKLAGATLDEALKAAGHNAGRRVRKWHPDGSDLSHFEKNVMRRSVLFYSWIRKAIPLVVEATVTKPGRVMIYPKALQNFAAMQGIDLEGQSGFPDDQLFPSYIADSVQGPQWGESGAYMGVKPGIPNLDVMDEFASSPVGALRAAMGGINPLAKIPAEVASGNMVRTGTPIMDKSDYVDSQIPGANYVAKLLGGKSPSSMLVPGDGQMIQDTRVSPSNMGYEGNPNAGMGKGGMDFINWLLGLGLTDYSRPSSIISAQREQGGR